MTDRAVSVTLDYILLLMIAVVVLAGVTTVSASMIDSQVDSGMHDELMATGEKLAADIQDVERLVNASDDGTTQETLELQVDLPRQVSGESYVIRIGADGDQLELSGTSRDVEVTVSVSSGRLGPTEQSIPGGAVMISLTEDGDIEVRSP